jgi:hypothetical protein
MIPRSRKTETQHMTRRRRKFFAQMRGLRRYTMGMLRSVKVIFEFPPH